MAIMIIIIKSHWIMDASGVRLNALRRSFVRKERKWRKYFSYGKKKKKNLFSANGNESCVQEVVEEGEEGMATVGK